MREERDFPERALERRPPADLHHIPDLWAIADTHFCHARIAEYAGRPADHNEQMLANWRECVGVDDVVLHLGDIHMGRPEHFASIARQLPGRKYLICGNHDRRGVAWYQELGFEPIKPFSFRYRGWTISCTHRPYTWFATQPQKILNVHGHIHEKEHQAMVGGRNFDRRFLSLCVERIGYRPVRLRTMLDARIDELEA